MSSISNERGERMTSGCWFWGPSWIRVMAAVFIWYHVRCHFFQVTYGAFSKFGVRILPLIPSAKMIRPADLEISGVICYANNTQEQQTETKNDQKRIASYIIMGTFLDELITCWKNGANMSNQHLLDIQDITWTFIHADPSTPIWSYIWELYLSWKTCFAEKKEALHTKQFKAPVWIKVPVVQYHSTEFEMRFASCLSIM